MAQNNPSMTSAADRRPGWATPVIIFIGVLVVLAVGYFGATKLEENDAFCASCHSEPENTYFQRTAATRSVDLASAHAHLTQTQPEQSPTRCIDCHAGPGFSGRAHALSIGARDALKWFGGSATQPAKTTQPLNDAACLQCHSAVASDTNFDRHFHRYLMQWQQKDPSAGRCATCHTAHTLDGNNTIGFLQQQRAQAVCVQCHKAQILASQTPGIGDKR